MRTTRYLFLMLLMALFGMGATAQQHNVLQVPDVTTQIGNVQLPVIIENTDEIVGVQFDLTLPEGVTAETVGTLANRSDGHTVTVSQLSNGVYRVLLHSTQNRPLRGQLGVVMYLPINIPSSFEEGSEYAMTVANAVLAKATGENVLTETVAGKIHISKLPDLTVKNITFDKQALNPGDRLVASWQVENIGELATNGGWSEQVSLVSEDISQSKLIATAHYDGILDASGIVSRQVEVTLPFLLGIDGQVKPQIRIVPDSNTGESASAQANNTQTSASTITVNKLLSVEFSPKRIDENSTQNIALRVNRSGQWTQAETFTIATSTDIRVNVPSSITIPANQSGAIVYFRLTDNDVLDNDSIVIVSVEGNGYEKVSSELVIDDNEHPDLTVTASQSVITEGDTFTLTITTSRVSSQPITVTLTSENSKRFSFPQTVNIPAGESSVQVTVQTIDDELPILDLSNSFTVSAPGYNKGEVIILLKDNDLPVLELTLTPGTVSEGAGVVSVAGVLRRTSNTNSKITVKLSDDSDGGLYFGNRTLELAKGVEEVHFNFGPVDNANVDGDRTYTITAAVWLSSCSCSAAGESAGNVTAQLMVLDNDGPALSLISSVGTIMEGGAATLTISRNTTDNTQPLTVTINSDYDEGLTYSHTVTIPAGQQSVEVEVISIANDVSDDSHTVIFTVRADDYAAGTCYVMVTDQTLPDAIIAELKVVENNIQSGSEYVLSITVKNDGFAALPSQTRINLYMEGIDGSIGRMYTQKNIAPGETEVIIKTFQSPLLTGDYKLFAIVNEVKEIEELQYTNNTSESVVLCLLPPFTATIEVDKQCYMPDESVVISGNIKGKDIANQEVEIYIINNGLRQSFMVYTSPSGEFIHTWKPYKQQNGHFVVGACVPGENKLTEQSSFDVIGLSIANDFTIVEVTKGESYHGSIDISNRCAIPLKNIQIASISSENVEFFSESISNIASNENATINFSIKGLVESEGKDWLQLPLTISCSEGGKVEHKLYYYVHTPQAKLESNITSIKTTMVKGKNKDYQFVIRNIGKGETGNINIDTGQTGWIDCVTSAQLPSLEYGDSTNVVLRFTPTDEMELNNPLDGWMAINCENGEGCIIHLNVEPVSEETGTLTFDICDDYTFNSPDKPHVQGAIVKVMHPITHEIIATATTNSEGICSFLLSEGYYYYELCKEQHQSYSNYVMVDAGRDKKLTTTLLINTVQIDIHYEKTEIEDVYNITTTMTYETNVPTPVVIINMPDSIPAYILRCGESMLLNASLTNIGLVKALDARLEFPLVSGLKFKILENEMMDLLPQQSIQIPILVTRVCSSEDGAGDGSGQGGSSLDPDNQGFPDLSNIPCFIPVYVNYGVQCDKKEEQGYSKFLGLKPCFSQEITANVVNYQPNSPGRPSVNGGGGSGETQIRSGNLPILMPDCNTQYNNAYQYLAKFIECLVKGIYSNLPVVGPGMKFAFCADDLEQCTRSNKTDFRCAESLISCMFFNMNGDESSGVSKTLQIVSPITSFFNCQGYLQQFLDSVNTVHGGEPLLTKRRASGIVAFPLYVFEYQTKLNNVAIALQGEVDYLKEIFGNANFLQAEAQQLVRLVDVVSSTMNENNDDNLVLSELLPYKPDNISEEDFELFIERMNNTTRMQKGETVVSDNYIHDNLIDAAIQKISMAKEYASSYGFETISDMMDDLIQSVSNRYSNESESVCASVSIELSQQMTMTRQAIRGTLTIGNTNEEKVMTDIKLQFILKDENGNIATEKEFEIATESLININGEKDLTSGWSLGAGETGIATLLFIPTKHAAPTIPVDYTFTGTISYVDPNTDIEIIREFKPTTLTVNPSPDLELTYLMQRDVYGDDPLTSDVVEPMEPAEFALIINNKGYGEAKNVRMLTQQPKIIDNEKGLLIDFNIKSSQVNGEAANLSFGQTIANSFGTIPAHSQAYAQWWLESSLLGHFTSYEVEATHVTNYGNADLSLVDTVTIHEMIHGFTVKNDGEKQLRGYLVNDIVDADDMPDMLYFTDATQQSVYVVKEHPEISRQSDTEYVLKVKGANAGWNYGSLLDPTYGKQKLVKVVRADGREINVDNIWQTDRTLRDGLDWLYEHRLHFVGNMAAEGETFYLSFEPKPDVVLEVESYAGVPGESAVLKEQLNAVTVKFNKPIKAETFTTEDITLNCQGVAQDASQIVIEKQSEQEFKLTLNEVTLLDGYYVLTVHTAGIEDNEGFCGSTGKQAAWIQFVDGKVALKMIASPSDGGTITPGSGRYDYDSHVTLNATPAEGYDFVGWMEGEATFSSEKVFDYHVVSASELKALFSIKHYNVNISYDPLQGVVEGAATGIYNHGTQLQLMVYPASGYDFDAWLVNDNQEGNDSPMTFVVNRNMNIVALFRDQVTTEIQNTDSDAAKVSIKLLNDNMYVTGNFDRIHNVTIYDMRGVKVFSINNMPSDQCINVGRFNAGIYCIQLLTDRGVCQTKILKR